MKSYSFKDTTAKIVELIEVKEKWEADPEFKGEVDRNVTMYFTKSGYLVAIDDPHHAHDRMDYERF